MAEAEDLVAGIAATEVRVVLRNRAIQVQPHQLALQHGEILGHALLPAFALADEDVALAVECKPRAEVQAAIELGLLPVDHPQVAQRVVGECRSGRGSAGGAAITWFSVGEPDPLVGRVVRVEHDVEQATLALGVDVRHAGDRCRHAAVGRNPAQAARTFADHETAFRQQGDCPGVLQPGRDGLHAHPACCRPLRLGGRGPGWRLRGLGTRIQCRRRRDEEHESACVAHGLLPAGAGDAISA